LLVHCASQDFDVPAPTVAIDVPRQGSSDDATFEIRARRVGPGTLTLLIYDEVRLIGVLTVMLVASPPPVLRLAKTGQAIFRDPATEVPRAPSGPTIQVSLTADGKIAFHALLPRPTPDAPEPSLVPMGTSTIRFKSGVFEQIREHMTEVGQALGTVQGDPNAALAETLAELQLTLNGAGAQIGQDVLSRDVRTFLNQLGRTRGQGASINWVIGEPDLHEIPWELARDPLTDRPLAEGLVLIRVPMFDPLEISTQASATVAKDATPGTTPPRLVYVLGSHVVPRSELGIAREIVASAATKYKVETNFTATEREEMTNARVVDMARGASIVHLLCHGVLRDKQGLALQIEPKPTGRLFPLHVPNFKLAPGALVFVNACSSATRGFDALGQTTFGWNFRKAGAAVYIGALAPVTTDLAMKFARHFFDAYLGEGLPASQALHRARMAYASGSDPTWMLYVIYGDLSECVPSS
jgi:hypothetical protein